MTLRQKLMNELVEKGAHPQIVALVENCGLSPNDNLPLSTESLDSEREALSDEASLEIMGRVNDSLIRLFTPNH